MTRFARAKGSKACNEKTPEDSTPWEVMKNQLLQSKKETEDAKNRQEAEKKRIENYEKFLKEQKIQKRKATWCDFPETQSKQSTKSNEQQPAKKQKKNKKQKQNADDSVNKELKDHNQSKELETTSPKKKKNKNKNKNNNINNENTTQEVDTVPSTESQLPKKKTKKNKKSNFETGNQVQENDVQDSVTNAANVETDQPTAGKVMKSKKNKNKKANSNPNNDDNSASTINITNGKKKKEINPAIANKNNKIKALKKKKDKPLVDGKPVRRKEVTERSFQLIINGKDIELVRFDGFPIMRKDAERIEELKNSMIKKGIPKSEVNRTIKLERRRAEKALARLKRDVCYNCRKGGHNLSDCPDLKSKIPGVDAAEGVCFKCGSTEHRQFECKVQRDKEFRFATCFICKEPGHIARQCPDNPKGLYPNGGGCKLCGDVTHLRKDCPTINDKKESTSIKLSTLSNTDNLEDIGQLPQTTSFSEDTSKKPKKITF